MIGFLTDQQRARIKMVRERAWNRPFTVEQVIMGEADDVYDDPVQGVVSTVLYGDYVWREEREARGTAGGILGKADILLATDILHSGMLMSSLNTGVRLVVDGVTLAPNTVTAYHDSGEVVVAATRIIA